MKSTSTAGDFSSAEVPRMSSAASLAPARLHVQATEIHPQPVQYGADGEESPTGVFVKQDLARDSPEATIAGAQADTKEDLPIDETLKDALMVRHHQGLRPGYRQILSTEEMKKKGSNYARVASLYTEGLEYRVGDLEKELLALQYEVGSKERVFEGERQVIRDVCTMFR